MKINFKHKPVVALAVLASVYSTANATNGMNLEGYGPVSTAMGGTSQAFDHGNAAMIQNPATLSMGTENSRIDVAVGVLGPRITSSMGGMTAKSSGTSYAMPAFGYSRKIGSWTTGIGVFAQGGMGTEYSEMTFLALGSGQPVRSELGFGRVIFPISYSHSPRLSIGGSIDYVWGGLDLRMAAPGAELAGLVTGASGNLATNLPALAGAPWTRIDFSNGSDFTGSAKATGWAAKIGFTYQVNDALTVGGSHHFKTALNDMTTGDTDARLSASSGFSEAGRITVLDFQWPSATTVGLAWKPSPKVMIAADLSHIRWSDVMDQFKMRFDSATPGNGGVSFALPQNWSDQNVIKVGVSFAVNDALTVRAGFNYGKNPVPDRFLNPLFPATVERHYTFGLGYNVSSKSSINASVTVTPTASNRSGNGVVVQHRQRNLQVMYTARH